MMFWFKAEEQLCLQGVSLLSNKIENTGYEQTVSKCVFYVFDFLRVYRKQKHKCFLPIDPLAKVEVERILFSLLLSKGLWLLFTMPNSMCLHILRTGVMIDHGLYSSRSQFAAPDIFLCWKAGAVSPWAPDVGSASLAGHWFSEQFFIFFWLEFLNS